KGAPRRVRVHVPARQRPALSGAGRARRAPRGRGLPPCRVPPARRRDRGAPPGDRRLVNALADLRQAPGLEEYLDELELHLEEAVGSHTGLVAAVGAEALAAGGKRLRPALVFLAASPGRVPSVAAGVAVELVHMATLIHDDLIDRAE